MSKLIVLVVFFISVISYAQDTTDYKRLKVLPLPAFSYSPETSLAIGAVCLFTFNMYNDTNTRASNAKIKLLYTLNKQFIIENYWNYFFKNEKWYTDGSIHYSLYPDLYYGVGPKTSKSNRVNYNSNRFLFLGNVYKNVGEELFAGVNLKYINFSNVNNLDSINYNELQESSTIGIGLSFLKDNRNSILTPKEGWYLRAHSGYNFSIKNHFESSLDGRYYKTWKKRYTLAGRFYSKMIAGSPAFYDYSIIGGDNIVRGYRQGRYRDKNLTTLQVEFRAHLFWRIGLAAFGGVSNLFPTIGKFDINTVKPNAGLGLRVLFSKKDDVWLRLDYAIGENGNSGFYVSFGESF